jgi:molybdopterin-guanine dinucleotide biosynthesis protein B
VKRPDAIPPIVAFSGASGAGKTTLLVKLIPALVARGLTVAALKRSGHPHPLDRPGKDSARLKRAGAVAVAVQGPLELAYFGPPVGGVRALARLLPGADLVVAEGFKDEPVPRVEVHRSSIDRTFLCARDRRVIAVVSDVRPPRAVPWFTPREVDALAELLCRFALRGRRARGRALASRQPRGHRLALEKDHERESTMARMTKSTGTSRGRRQSATRRTGRRSGGATVREAGRKGGRRTLERRGPEFYSRIGRKGGKSSGTGRRAASSRRSAAGSRRRTTTGGRRRRTRSPQRR